MLLALSSPFVSKPSHAVAPGVAGVASLVPGLGQAINGAPLEGLAWFSSILGGIILTGGNAYNQTIFFDLWMYNMYDAYRDAGAKRAAKQNLLVNYIASFNPLNVWGPPSTVPLAFNVAMALKPGRPKFALGPNSRFAPLLYMSFVSLGEEGLFRGFVFPGFTDIFFGSAIAGAVSSSLLFAAAHGLYSGQSSYAFQPYIFTFRTVGGLFWCWQNYRDNYDLRKSIFSHTWVDIVYEWDRQGMFGGGQVGSGGEKKLIKPNGLMLGYVFDI